MSYLSLHKLKRLFEGQKSQEVFLKILQGGDYFSFVVEKRENLTKGRTQVKKG